MHRVIPMSLSAVSIRRITIGSFIAFFLFGFADNLKGPTLPAVLQELHFNYAQGGTLVFGAYFGFLIATLLTGMLADRAGNKENVGTILGLLFTFAGVGGMLGPWLMGLVSNWAGLRWGFSLLLIFCLVMCAALAALQRLKIRAN